MLTQNKILISLLIFWWVLFVSMLITVTNWGNYPIDLVGTVTMVFVIGFGIVLHVVSLLGVFFIKKVSLKNISVVISALFLIISVMTSSSVVFDGERWDKNHENLSTAKIVPGLEDSTYQLKYINFNSVNEKKFLKLNNQNLTKEFEIIIPDEPSGYGMTYNQPKGVLYPTKDKNIYALEMYYMPYISVLKLDIDQGTLTYVKSLKAGSGGCKVEGTNIGNICNLLGEIKLNDNKSDISLGFINTEESAKENKQYYFLGLVASNGYFYDLELEGGPFEMPIVDLENYEKWAEIVSKNNTTLVLKTNGRIGNRIISIDLKNKKIISTKSI